MNQAKQPEDEFDIESVFEVDDYLYFYRDSLTDERSEAMIVGLERLLELDPPMHILDLACGFGRHANRLALRGYTVTGVDFVSGFLEIARKQATAWGVQVDYRQGDMRNIDFQSEFDLVLMLFSTFGYFEDDGNCQVLANITRALKPGGRFGFDIPNRDMTMKVLPPAVVIEKDKNLMINRNSFDPLSGRWHNRRIIIRNGIRKDKPFSIRLYNPTELKALLKAAGLRVENLYADWEGTPFSSDSRGMVVIARKSVAGMQKK